MPDSGGVIRVGDRYVLGEDKITVSRIGDDGRIHYERMTPDGKIWSSWCASPVPLNWEFAGRGPEVPQYCVNHPLREREVGTLFCPECVDVNAVHWAELTPDEGRATFAALQREDQGHD